MRMAPAPALHVQVSASTLCVNSWLPARACSVVTREWQEQRTSKAGALVVYELVGCEEGAVLSGALVLVTEVVEDGAAKRTIHGDLVARESRLHNRRRAISVECPRNSGTAHMQHHCTSVRYCCWSDAPQPHNHTPLRTLVTLAIAPDVIIMAPARWPRPFWKSVPLTRALHYRCVIDH
jgi:hypothetical protein